MNPEELELQTAAIDTAPEAPETEGESKGLHHRSRLRRRAIPRPGDLEDARLMELMLFEALPRCDTYDMAKTLLAQCGGIPGFMEGGEKNEAAVAALGEHTAVYLQVLRELCRRYEAELPLLPEEFPSLHETRRWLRRTAWPAREDLLTVLTLDARLKPLFFKEYGAAPEAMDTLTLQISKEVNASDANYLFLTIAHPDGFLAPNREETKLLLTLSDTCLHSSIYLAEAMIVNAEGVKCLSESASFPVGTFLQFKEKLS